MGRMPAWIDEADEERVTVIANSEERWSGPYGRWSQMLAKRKQEDVVVVEDHQRPRHQMNKTRREHHYDDDDPWEESPRQLRAQEATRGGDHRGHHFASRRRESPSSSRPMDPYYFENGYGRRENPVPETPPPPPLPKLKSPRFRHPNDWTTASFGSAWVEDPRRSPYREPMPRYQNRHHVRYPLIVECPALEDDFSIDGGETRRSQRPPHPASQHRGAPPPTMKWQDSEDDSGVVERTHTSMTASSRSSRAPPPMKWQRSENSIGEDGKTHHTKSTDHSSTGRTIEETPVAHSKGTWIRSARSWGLPSCYSTCSSSVTTDSSFREKATCVTWKIMALLYMVALIGCGYAVASKMYRSHEAAKAVKVLTAKGNVCLPGRIQNREQVTLFLSLEGLNTSAAADLDLRIEQAVKNGYNNATKECEDMCSRWSYLAKVDSDRDISLGNGNPAVYAKVETFLSEYDCPLGEIFASVYPPALNRGRQVLRSPERLPLDPNSVENVDSSGSRARNAPMDSSTGGILSSTFQDQRNLQNKLDFSTIMDFIEKELLNGLQQLPNHAGFIGIPHVMIAQTASNGTLTYNAYSRDAPNMPYVSVPVIPSTAPTPAPGTMNIPAPGIIAVPTPGGIAIPAPVASAIPAQPTPAPVLPQIAIWCPVGQIFTTNFTATPGRYDEMVGLISTRHAYVMDGGSVRLDPANGILTATVVNLRRFKDNEPTYQQLFLDVSCNGEEGDNLIRSSAQTPVGGTARFVSQNSSLIGCVNPVILVRRTGFCTAAAEKPHCPSLDTTATDWLASADTQHFSCHAVATSIGAGFLFNVIPSEGNPNNTISTILGTKAPWVIDSGFIGIDGNGRLYGVVSNLHDSDTSINGGFLYQSLDVLLSCSEGTTIESSSFQLQMDTSVTFLQDQFLLGPCTAPTILIRQATDQLGNNQTGITSRPYLAAGSIF